MPNDRAWIPTTTDLDLDPQLAPIAMLHNIIHPLTVALRAAHPGLKIDSEVTLRTPAEAAARAVLITAYALQELLLAYRASVREAQLSFAAADPHSPF